MKLSEFITLTNEEKKYIIFTQGAPIAKRKTNESKIFLFQLPNFYVEIHCNIDDKKINEFMMYSDTENLTLYLNAIKIDGLFDNSN
jgi:hypothetical protein